MFSKEISISAFVSGMEAQKHPKRKYSSYVILTQKMEDIRNVKIIHRAETKIANLMYKERLDNLTLKS